MNYSFKAGRGNRAYGSWVGPISSVVSVVVSGIGRGWSCRAGIGQPEERGRSERAGFERGCIRDTVQIQRGSIRVDTLFNQSGYFYPIIPDKAIKVGRGWSAVWCEGSLTYLDIRISYYIIRG